MKSPRTNKGKKRSYDTKGIAVIAGISAIFFILAILLINMHRPEYALLSFDVELVDGSEPVLDILDSLKENNVHATFFVMGKYLLEYPSIVNRMQVEGHEVACHSFSHPNFRKLSLQEKEDELVKCIDVQDAVIGTKPVGFRAPYHKIDRETNELLKELGFSYDASHIENLGFLFPDPDIEEIRISYFIFPLSDVICLYYLHMPPSIYFWLLKHVPGEYASLAFHPHHLYKHPERFDQMLKYYAHQNITFITHQDYLKIK